MKQLLLCLLILCAANCFAQQGRTETLLDAIESNDTKAVKYLLEQTPSLLDSTHYYDGFMHGLTVYPIHVAILNGKVEMIELLLSAGADTRKERIRHGLMNSSKDSCLEILVERDNAAVLLKKFYDRIYIDPKVYTASLLRASESGNKDVIRLLLAKGELVLIPNE